MLGDTILRTRAKAMLEIRRARLAYFGKAMFGEPAWEMLLLIYLWGSDEIATVARLARSTDTTLSTALRWIQYLESQRWIRRDLHPQDKRSAIVVLTQKGNDALEQYLSKAIALKQDSNGINSS